MTSSAAIAETCPSCHTGLVTEHQEPPWCERCEWGLARYDPSPEESWFSRWLGPRTYRIAYRLTHAQFHQLVGVADLRPPTWTATRVAIIAIATAYYLVLVTSLGLGLWLVGRDFPNVSIMPGLLLLLIVAALAPRFGRLSTDDDRLSRADAPTLYALIDRVAEAVGTSPPHMVVIESGFSAAAAAVGLRRRRVLLLGMGLWGALTPPQRVALLAHELGHFVNGDIRRGVLTQPAMMAMGRLADLFGPTPTINAEFLPIVSFYGPKPVTLYERIVAAVMRVIASGLWVAHLGLVTVALRHGQRAEYLADQRAARIAGTRATTELLDLLVQRNGLSTVVAARMRAGETEQGWRSAATDLLTRQRDHINRLRQLSIRYDTSLHSSHPPTGLRARLITAASWQDPALHLTESDSERIDTELASHYRRCRRDIAHSGY